MKTALFSFPPRIPMETFDSKTTSRIVGVSLRQLQYWDEQNFLRPSIKPAGGRGTKRLYSFNDLICLKVVKDLTRHGFNLQKIRRCVKPLKEDASRTEGAAESLKYLNDGEARSSKDSRYHGASDCAVFGNRQFGARSRP
jgi:DNA-binding transcriptional MerR regulator